MTFPGVAAALLLAALPTAGAAWLVRRIRRAERITWAGAVVSGLVAAVAAAGVVRLERAVLHWTELSVEASPQSRVSSFLVLLFFVAPLEEATKALVVWPAAVFRRVEGPRLGVAFGVCVASGFAAVEAILYLASGEFTLLRAVRAFAGVPVQVFCGGLWGYAWGERARGGRFFATAWIGAVALHALYDHIVFGRGPGFLAAAVPLLAAMGLIAWSALRDLAPSASGDGTLLPISLPEPPSLRVVRRALQRADQPLLVRWIAFGALVNVGMVLVCVAAAIVFARRIGLDLALADETDVRSSGPLLFLGAAVLVAFPLSGYLVARASGSHGVLEPAFAAALAIAAAVALLSVTAPSAVIFALAVAPIAFGLACGGAWFGLDSS